MFYNNVTSYVDLHSMQILSSSVTCKDNKEMSNNIKLDIQDLHFAYKSWYGINILSFSHTYTNVFVNAQHKLIKVYYVFYVSPNYCYNIRHNDQRLFHYFVWFLYYVVLFCYSSWLSISFYLTVIYVEFKYKLIYWIVFIWKATICLFRTIWWFMEHQKNMVKSWRFVCRCCKNCT